jgi:hypothetical protein
MSTTCTVKNRTFTSRRGNACTVWNTKTVGRQGGWVGLLETVRTFVEVAGRELEVETGCSFRAESVVEAAGL